MISTELVIIGGACISRRLRVMGDSMDWMLETRKEYDAGKVLAIAIVQGLSDFMGSVDIMASSHMMLESVMAAVL